MECVPRERVSRSVGTIGIEIGGSVLRIGLVSKDGKIVRSARKDSSALRDQSTASRILLDEITDFLGDRSCEGIGIAMAGLVDNERRMMVLASNLGWRDFPLGDEIAELTGLPVVTDKDTNMAALGELHAGAGRGLSSFIYMTLGTGAGGSVIYDQRLIRGIGNRGGEFGHVYSGGDKVCGCGLTGCLETWAGAVWIGCRAREIVQSGCQSQMLSLAGDIEDIDSRIVVQAAEQGDQPAKGILADAAEAVGVALLNAVRMIYPEAVIIGGSIGSIREFIFDPIKDFVETKSVLPRTGLPPVRVLPAELGDSAAMIGAGLSVFEETA